jgi:hydroxymethylglutaryl-CoA lyase
MATPVRIVEVGPRDGLQNEAQQLSTDIKLELIERLADTGLRDIEATAFVSPTWVPQMADHEVLMRRLPRRPGVRYPVLTPNLKGFEAAVASGATDVSVFAAASEGFSKRNINCTIAESIQRFVPVLAAAKARGIRVRGYVSCVVACPIDGPIAPSQVADVAARLHDLGCDEISLGDTIGVATHSSVLRMLDAVAAKIPIEQLAGHYHDTYGMAIANVLASYQFGLRIFDSAIAGLGGCPYAAGATGNVATEEVVYLLHGLGANTGTQLDALVDVAAWISTVLQRPPGSRVARAVLAKRAAAVRS